MKKIKFFTIVSLMICALFLNSCGKKSKEHTEDAKENIKEANTELNEAANDASEEVKAKATADWQKFKTESESEIVDMENQAKVLRKKIAEASTNEKIKLNKDLDKLNQKIADQKEKLAKKNAEFEAEISKVNDSITAKNETFKREFKHDSKELSTSLKDFFKDNVK